MCNWKKSVFASVLQSAAVCSFLTIIISSGQAQEVAITAGGGAPLVAAGAGKAVKAVDTAVLKRFTAWMEQYNAAESARKQQLEAEGVQLAKERLPLLGALIVQNPAEAIKYAVLPVQRQKLPKTVVAELEQFVEGNALYDLAMAETIVDAPVPNQPGQTRKMVRETLIVNFKVGNQSYIPYFYGKRGALLSMKNVPVYGIAVGQNIAVHESPLRLLEKGESVPLYAYPGKGLTACPICKKDASKGLVAVSGATVYYFDEAAHVDEFRNKLWQMDNKSFVVE